MYFLRVLFVCLSVAVVSCAAREVKFEKKEATGVQVPSKDVLNDIKQKSTENSESKPSISEIKEDVSQTKKPVSTTKTSPKLLSSDKLSMALISEVSEDGAVRSKKSPYRQARFEELSQSPQQIHYLQPPAQLTTVCIVVKSHNHPVTLCGPPTNGSEVQGHQTSAAHESTQQVVQVRQSIPPLKSENHQTLPKSAFVQQQMPPYSLYRMPAEPSQQSALPPPINMLPSSFGNKALGPPYGTNKGNVVTSNVPLSLNCHLQPGPASGPLAVGQYQSQELYDQPGATRHAFGPTFLQKEIQPQMYLMHGSQRSSRPMYVLPDGSPIEASTVHLDNQQFERTRPDNTALLQQQVRNQHFINLQDPQKPESASIHQVDSPFTMPPPETHWQPIVRGSSDVWTSQEQIQSLDNSLLRSPPEYITHEYLRQWDDAYRQQMGRSSEGSNDGPSISYIPFYFHPGDEKFKLDDGSNLRASEPEKPITEEDLKKKAQQQEQEIKETKMKLEELRAKFQKSEEKISKMTSEMKRKSEESMDMQKTEEKTSETPRKDSPKVQDKRHAKKSSM